VIDITDTGVGHDRGGFRLSTGRFLATEEGSRRTAEQPGILGTAHDSTSVTPVCIPHGARSTSRAEPGKGSRFTIRLPSRWRSDHPRD